MVLKDEVKGKKIIWDIKAPQIKGKNVLIKQIFFS